MSESSSYAASPNIQTRKLLTVITMASIGAMGLAGCSQPSRSMPENSDCSAITPDLWTPVPQEINAPEVADRLGQETGKVTGGKIGAANCEKGIDFDMVLKGAPVRVSGTPSGISDRCLTVLSEAPSTPKNLVYQVGVLCPAQ